MIVSAKNIYIIGNGGSASTANHFANDLVKMCGFRAISLCANEAIVMAYANDNGYENIFVDQLRVFLDREDLLITISGSGTSKNIVRAIEYANSINAKVWSFPTMKECGCDMQAVETFHLDIAHQISKDLSDRT